NANRPTIGVTRFPPNAPRGIMVRMATLTRRYWLTFPTEQQVHQPILWKMSRAHPEVSFDIRQATVKEKTGIMAVQFEGEEQELIDAVEFLKGRGVIVEPIEKSIVEG